MTLTRSWEMLLPFSAMTVRSRSWNDSALDFTFSSTGRMLAVVSTHNTMSMV